MKRGLSYTLALISLGFSTLAVTPIHAQTTGVGPYYATPSWDQTLPSNTRFIVLSNFNSQAVLDRETGLVWERQPTTAKFRGYIPPGTFGGSYAEERCIFLSLGDRMGWRLPSLAELMSLIDPTQQQFPALPSGHPFVLGGELTFWSSTPYYPNLTGTSDPIFRTAEFGQFRAGAGSSSDPQRVWCVRGGAITQMK